MFTEVFGCKNTLYGPRGKSPRGFGSAKGSFATALSGTTAGKAVLPCLNGNTAYGAVLPRLSGNTACVKRYYCSSGTTTRERYYRLYAVLLESEWDSFRASQTDLVRAKLTLWRLSLQV